LWGETSGTAAKSYGVFGKATAPNSWAGWVEGNVMINGNGFLTGMIPITSDANLKTNVQALTNASEFLDQLLPKTYDFLVDEHPEIALPSGPQMGFIAQDVELILPQLVKQATIPATYDSTGAQLTASEDIKTLNYIGIIPLLSQAISSNKPPSPNSKTRSTTAVLHKEAWPHKAAQSTEWYHKRTTSTSSACSSSPIRLRTSPCSSTTCRKQVK